MNDESPKRASARVPVYCPVSMWGDPTQSDSVCVNLSTGGMALAVAEPLPVGTLLRISAILPSGRVFEATVVVVWARSDKAHRIGVCFLTLKDEARLVVNDLVEHGQAA
ncbi:MAG: PilZ domain-containing protein [Deltaproteobacteria bacterium]|nr:PilZ domain-containing protein [Deltaproteobacteria bacterium]